MSNQYLITEELLKVLRGAAIYARNRPPHQSVKQEMEDGISEANSILDAGPVPEPRVPSSVGNWLWGEMMDYCKVNKIHPGDANGLFEIVTKAREKFSEPRDMSNEIMTKDFHAWMASNKWHETYSVEDLYLGWEAAWKFVRGEK